MIDFIIDIVHSSLRIAVPFVIIGAIIIALIGAASGLLN